MTLDNACGRRNWMGAFSLTLAFGAIVLNTQHCKGADVTASMAQFIKISAPSSGDLAPDGTFYFLEANPNPELANYEELAESAKQVGLSYEALIQRILNMGLRR